MSKYIYNVKKIIIGFFRAGGIQGDGNETSFKGRKEEI